MKGQRRELGSGDVFVAQLDEDGTYRFGRVVKTREQTTAGPRFPGDALVYLFETPAESPSIGEADLSAKNLLMAPLFTMKWMWTKGYFRTLENVPFQPGELLEQHCFYSAGPPMYVDEDDNELDGRREPCGWYSLSNFETLERDVMRALAGTPRTPPEVPGIG